MTGLRCPHEPDLLDALSDGRWPEACDRALREHVEGCGECSDLLIVADAFVNDRRAAEREADIPTSGAVWWRMQLRMEREAKEAAEKTVGRAHGLVVGLTVAVITAVLLTSSLIRMGWSWLASEMPALHEFLGMSSTVPMIVIALVGIAVVVFAPVAVYLALAED